MGMSNIALVHDQGADSLAPVMIELTEVCHFKKKTCKTCGKAQTNKVHLSSEKGGTCKFKRQTKCANCNLPKAHRDHMGAPPSFNVLGSGSQRAYIGLKQQWESVFYELLEESDLPRGIKSVMVEGEVSYADGQKRDEGNIKSLLEKFFGDTIKKGWIEDDAWGQYEFGKLQRRDEPGVSRLRLVLFPSY